MFLVTTDYIEGKKFEMLGMVQGSTIQARHIGKDIGSGFRNLVGGEMKAYTEMMNESREVAIQRMIGQAAFSQCEKLVSINLPKGVFEIADSTFSFCKSLEIVEIPDTVSSIGEQAFAGCEKLRKLTLPNSVKFIDKNAFAYCPRLTIVCVENSYVYKYCLSNAIPVETYLPAASR